MLLPPLPPSGLFRGWRRDAGEHDVGRAEVAWAVEKQRLQIVTPKAYVRRCRLAMDDATELLSLWIENIDSSRAAAIHVSGRVDFHTVRTTRLRPGEVREHPVGLLREGAVRGEVESADMAAAEIVDIDHAFIGRKGEPVGKDHVVEEERNGAEIGRD